jgi:hypothetical protein
MKKTAPAQHTLNIWGLNFFRKYLIKIYKTLTLFSLSHRILVCEATSEEINALRAFETKNARKMFGPIQ